MGNNKHTTHNEELQTLVENENISLIDGSMNLNNKDKNTNKQKTPEELKLENETRKKLLIRT